MSFFLNALNTGKTSVHKEESPTGYSEFVFKTGRTDRDPRI